MTTNVVTAFELPELSGQFHSSTSPVVPQVAMVLALAIPMSSANARPEDCWAPLFEQSSTIYNSPCREKPRTRVPVDELLPLTAEQLAAVQSFFGLSKTQLAQVCRVQRQTIYDWYAGNFEAEGDNARRLKRLYMLAERLRREGREPVSARLAKRELSSGNTLVELLGNEEIYDQEIRVVVSQLDQATLQRRARSAAAVRQRLGWEPTSEDEDTRNLHTNIEDFADG